MRLGIYAGSFNPPHEGHKRVADYVLQKDLVDEVLLLPTPNYWHKTDLIDINERVEMLKFYEEEKIKVDNVHNIYPYTYQVLEALKKDYPNDELYLIIGSDNLEKLHEWKNIEEILKNKIIVLRRGSIKENEYLLDYKDQFIYCDDFDYIDVSSTSIREGDTFHLNPQIVEYIRNHHLYENIQ